MINQKQRGLPRRAQAEPPHFPDIEGQRGLATIRQLLDAGYTRSAIRHALAGKWQAPRSGVVAPHRGPLDADARLVAAALWAGPTAVLTGGVALDRYGLQDAARSEAIFLVPATARSRADGPVRTVRTTREIVVGKEFDCVATVRVERALVDTATHQNMSPRDLKAMTISALQRRLSHADRVHAELERAPRRGTAPIREALAAFARGAWSLPEDAFGDLLRADPVLPPMLRNVELQTLDETVIGTPDVFFPAAGVAVQVHSRTFHSGYDEDGTDLWSLTVEKDAAFSEHDVIVIGVTPRSIVKRPQQTLERVHKVVMRNVGRPYGPVMIDGATYGHGEDASGLG